MIKNIIICAAVALIFSTASIAASLGSGDTAGLEQLPPGGVSAAISRKSNEGYVYRQERLRKSSASDEYSTPIDESKDGSDKQQKNGSGLSGDADKKQNKKSGKEPGRKKQKKARDENAQNRKNDNSSIDDTAGFEADYEEEYASEVKEPWEELEIFGRSFFASAPAYFNPRVDMPVPDDYKISTGDVLEISFWNEASPASNIQAQVDSKGGVKIPSVGTLPASGLKLKEFESKTLAYISKKFGKVQGFARLVEIRNIQVTISGEARRPGQYSVSGLTTAYNMIYAAGGPGDIGSLRNIKVIRHGKVISTIDYYRFLLDGIPAGDSALQSGDVIHFPVAGAICDIYGEVRRPARYEMKSGEKISDLIAIAGGLNPGSYAGSVRVARYSENRESVVMDVDAASAIANPESSANIALKSGDRVGVFPVIEEYSNAATISGPVKAPGVYEVRPGMKVSDLVKKARGFDGEVYTERGDIFRRNDDGSTTIISFSVEGAMNGDATQDIALAPRDEVVLLSPEDATYMDRTVTILGEVKTPGKYRRSSGMTALDILNIAGGPMPSAASTMEVARISNSRTGETELLTLNLGELLEGRGNCELKDGDVVIVKKEQSAKTKPGVVSILGEVVNPGHYALTSDNERMSSILKRSGGLTARAFPRGAVFIRPKMSEINKEQSAIVKEIAASFKNYAEAVFNAQSRKTDGNAAPVVLPSSSDGATRGQSIAKAISKKMLEDSKDGSAEDEDAKSAAGLIPERILIRFNEAAASPSGFDDLVLRDGDVIVVPEKPSTVIVSGAVVNPASFPFLPGKKMKFYLNRAGGYAEDSNPAMSVVVRANGEVYPFKSVDRIEEGDIIIVPWKPTRLETPKDKWERLQQITTMTSGLLTSVYLIDQLGK